MGSEHKDSKAPLGRRAAIYIRVSGRGQEAESKLIPRWDVHFASTFAPTCLHRKRADRSGPMRFASQQM